MVCLMGTSAARAAHVDVEAIAAATLPAFGSRTPATLAGQERMEGMKWEPANPEFGAPLRLVPETMGCMFPGGDDPPPPVPAPGERSGAEVFVQPALSFDDAHRPRVGSFRHEVLVGEGDGAKLVVTRGYYDRLSLGLRAVDRTEVGLTVLSESPRVYGFRDGTMLEIVMPIQRMGSVVGRDAEGRSRTFACTHARVAVATDGPSGTAMINASHTPEGTPKNRRRVELETIQLSLSVTRTSRDPAPWVSLAIGILH
jgi:hypothetical protein